jgi:inner membrane transporter RhtA
VAISFAGPLGVAVLGSRRPIDFLWVGLAGLGILLLSPLANTKLDPIGVILSIGSAISWAIYIVLTKRVTHIFPGHVALAYSMGSAALLLLPFGAGSALKVLADPALMLISLVVALLSSAIPFGLEFQALKHVSSRAFGLLVSLEPMVATVIGFVLLGERLELRALIGIVCVTVAAVATARESGH